MQGQPNAKIIIRLHNSDGLISFQSNEVGPNADNNAIYAGTTSASSPTNRVTQSIENTGIETAYYSGWAAKPIGADAPTDATIRNFRNGKITGDPIT